MQRFKTNKVKQELEYKINVPWNVQIANLLGISPAELTKNLPLDPTLQASVSSTCSAIRNYSVTQLLTERLSKDSAFYLRELC